jgi:SAM-dependent methyltransferase
MRPPNFDPVARVYRWAEYLTLGPLLQRTRTHFLERVHDRRQALVLGDGDGRFLAQLLAGNASLHAVAVDTSSAMLALLRRRCSPSAGRLETRHGSALDVTFPTADLIVTHFFLDCLRQSEVDDLAIRLAATVPPGTLWLLSDFGQPHPRALRPIATLYVRGLYLAFRMLTGLRVTRLPDPQSALAGAGFTLLSRHDKLFGLIYTELWQRR